MSRCSGFFLLLPPNSTLDQSHSEPSPGLPILFLTTSNDHAMIIMVIMSITMIMLNFVAIILQSLSEPRSRLPIIFPQGLPQIFCSVWIWILPGTFNSQFDFIYIIDFQCNLDQKEFAVGLCKKVEIAVRNAVIFP